MSYFISKEFPEIGLDKVDYWRCGNCGFVVSKTHVEMSPELWSRLNHQMHAVYQGTGTTPYDDPLMIERLVKQADLLNDAAEIGLLKKDGKWLDYACGDGKLSEILRERHGLKMLNYERYMPKKEGFLEESALKPGGFSLVLTTSVFEHLARREYFDAMEALVHQQGVLGVHTLVCEAVPADPRWFYMNPVHCAFHTNKSMEILIGQWGYSCSVYNADAKLWLCFKDDPQSIETLIREANTRSGQPQYIFKKGFVDYWKGSPMQRSFVTS